MPPRQSTTSLNAASLGVISPNDLLLVLLLPHMKLLPAGQRSNEGTEVNSRTNIGREEADVAASHCPRVGSLQRIKLGGFTITLLGTKPPGKGRLSLLLHLRAACLSSRRTWRCRT